MNKNLLLAVAVPALLLLSGCSDDDQSLPSGQPGINDPSSLFDPLFAKELERRGYIESSDNISLEAVARITELDVSGEYDNRGELKSLRGIEYFVNLESLDCDYNQLTELDVTSNMALTELSCSFNQLTELDVTNNAALTELSCGSNQLTELDVTNNTALTRLYCSVNQLTELDVTNNTALTELSCWRNQLTELDVTGNTALTELSCWNNQLTEMDISNNQNLEYFDCLYNPGVNGVLRVKV